MARKGRPPHPDVLTPREWEVLSLVREGLTNPQIAVQLGISADAAKYHVSEILSKLNVATREEAAAWRPEPAWAPVLRPAWARALGRWWPLVAGAGAAAGLATVGVLVWAVVASGNGEEEGSVEASASPAAINQATATTAPGLTASLTISDPIDLPEGVSLIVEIGGGESPIDGIERITGSASGPPRIDVLFYAGYRVSQRPDGSTPFVADYRANDVTLASPVEDTPVKTDATGQPYINSLAVSQDARTMAVGFCIRADCGGSSGVFSDQGLTVLYRSTDGGDTWSELERLDGTAVVRAIGADSQVLVERSSADPKRAGYSWLPSGEPVIVAPESTPIACCGHIVEVGGDRYATVAHVGTTPALQVVSGGRPVASYGVPGLTDVAGALSSTQFIGMVGARSVPRRASDLVEVPVLIDTQAETVQPISHPFLDESFHVAFMSLLAVRR